MLLLNSKAMIEPISVNCSNFGKCSKDKSEHFKTSKRFACVCVCACAVNSQTERAPPDSALFYTGLVTRDDVSMRLGHDRCKTNSAYFLTKITPTSLFKPLLADLLRPQSRVVRATAKTTDGRIRRPFR